MLVKLQLALLLASLFSALALKSSASRQSTSSAETPDAVYKVAMEFTRSGRNLMARTKLREAVTRWKTAGQPGRASAALLEIAALFESQGWFQDALECYQEVLGYSDSAGQGQADISASLARLYLRLHQLDLALKYYKQALSIGRRLGDPSTEALSLAGIAAVSAQEGNFKDSATYLSRATKIAPVGGSESRRAETLRLIGRAYERQGLMSEARSAFQQALSFYERASSPDEQHALLLAELSGLCLSLGEKEAAVAHAEKARKMAEELRSPEPQWHSWLALGKTQRALGQNGDALNSFYRAFSFIEMEAIHLSSDSLRVGFIQERLLPYRELAGMLVELGRYGEALRIVEHSRARAALDTLSSSRNYKAARDQLQKFKVMDNTIARLNAELNSPPTANDRRPLLESELEDVTLRRREMLIQSESERVKRFTAPATFKQIQEDTLQEREALLEFFLGDDRSYVWLVSADEVKCKVIADRKTIERTVAEYLTLLTKKPSNIHIQRESNRQRETGSKLFDMLFGDLKQSLEPGKRLIIVPDGLLYNLPFETLIHGDRFLVEQHEITYCPSASILSLFRRTGPGPAANGRMDLLAIGDPSFEKVNLQRFGLGFELKQLPGARNEVEYIGTIFPPEKTRVYLGVNATESLFKREAGGGYRRLHVATHTLVNEVFPARSGILFAVDKAVDDDGFLGLEEVAGLNLKGCELIVLSSCQTGRGELVRGEGLIGLGRAFILAGARSVALSLWNVSDLSTATIMKNFYRNIAGGMAVRESLRQAKLQIIRSSSNNHPFYWAAFVLMGDPD